jgi:hypothetical protein
MPEIKKVTLTEAQKEAFKNLVARLKTGKKPWSLFKKKAEGAK